MRRLAYWSLFAFILGIPSIQISLPGLMGSVNRMVGLAALLLWTGSVLMDKKKVRSLHPFHYATLAFVLWNVASLAWTPDLMAGIIKVQRYLQAFAILIVIWNLLPEYEDIKGAMQAYVIGASASIVSTIYDYLFTVTKYSTLESRFSAAGFDPNDLGVQLMIAIPFSFYLFVYREKKKSFHQLNGLFFSAAIVAVVLTGSRGAFLAGIPAFLFLVGVSIRARQALMIPIVIWSIVAVVALVQMDVSNLIERLVGIRSIEEVDSFSGRLDIWGAGLVTFLSHPIFGVGTNGFQTVVQTAGYAQKVAHNTYLSVLTELGIIGFLLFSGILCLVALSIIRQPKNIRSCCLISFLVWGIGTFSLTWEYVPQTWLLFALCVSAGNAEVETHDEAPSEMFSGSGMSLLIDQR